MRAGSPGGSRARGLTVDRPQRGWPNLAPGGHSPAAAASVTAIFGTAAGRLAVDRISGRSEDQAGSQTACTYSDENVHVRPTAPVPISINGRP
jgi:hypothetical protein